VPGSHQPRPPAPRFTRVFVPFGVGLALFCLAIAVTAACLGGDDKPEATHPPLHATVPGASTPGDVSHTPVLATFTPVPPNFTPEVVQTRSALQTAAALTATVQAQTTSTAPPAVTINPNTPAATRPANSITPPNANLSTSAGAAPSSIGSYNWFEPAINAGAQVTAPYILLPDSGASWATGTNATLTVENSPYALLQAEVKIYTFDGNVAIPTDQSGNPGTTPAFYPQQAPARAFNVLGPDVSFTPEVPPGRYIVDIRVNWSTPTGLDQLYTEYIFTMDVV